MRLDYWNHPLIIKAFRVKYRGGRLFTFAASYLVLLLAGGLVLYHYRAALGAADWARVYFVCMISLQFVFSSIIAISATSTSMQTEVATRTMDFQRIATLRPVEILIGKAVGEPAASYLLAMATIPIAVLCCSISNIPPLSVIILYLTLATTTFLMACLGLQHTLDPTSKGAQASGITGALLFGTFMATSMPLRFGPRGGFLELISAAVGLFTPILSVKGIAIEGSIWATSMPFFQVDVPYALLTPIAQLALAGLALHFMVRRLTQPLMTPLSKMQSYCVLLVLDLIWAALQFNALNLGEGLTAPAVRFAAGHTVFALLLAGKITPSRETFRSWTWRLRGKRKWIEDHLVGERTMNPLALLVYCAMAPITFCVTIALPVFLWHQNILGLTNWPALVNAALTCLLVIAAYGLFYQVAAITIGRGAGVSVFVAATPITIGPWLLGSLYSLDWLAGLSPIAMFINLQDPNMAPYPMLPLVLLHTLAAVFWAWALTRLMSRTVEQVEQRLKSMSLVSS